MEEEPSDGIVKVMAGKGMIFAHQLSVPLMPA